MALCHTAEPLPPLLHLRQPIALALLQQTHFHDIVLEHLPQGGGKGQKEYIYYYYTPVEGGSKDNKEYSDIILSLE